MYRLHIYSPVDINNNIYYFEKIFFFCNCTLKKLTLCNLKYNPQALQTGKPSPLRLHNVVVLVEQLEQIIPVFFTVCKRLLFGFINGLF